MKDFLSKAIASSLFLCVFKTGKVNKNVKSGMHCEMQILEDEKILIRAVLLLA